MMAKGGKLMKLKSVLKKLNSFSKLGRAANGSSAVAAARTPNSSSDDESYNNNNAEKISRNLHPVYVGKSRRRYLVGSDIVENPVFRELIERSGDNGGDSSVTVGCEVVLFEHLLWMLENADPQPESLDDLVEYYAC